MEHLDRVLLHQGNQWPSSCRRCHRYPSSSSEECDYHTCLPSCLTWPVGIRSSCLIGQLWLLSSQLGQDQLSVGPLSGWTIPVINQHIAALLSHNDTYQQKVVCGSSSSMNSVLSNDYILLDIKNWQKSSFTWIHSVFIQSQIFEIRSLLELELFSLWHVDQFLNKQLGTCQHPNPSVTSLSFMTLAVLCNGSVIWT